MTHRMSQPMEEQMEIVLTSRQIFVLATLVVGVALVMFVVGFSMGKRAERRKMVVGAPQATADLLTRLDEMEKESCEYVAKKALTEVRKREFTLEEAAPPVPAADAASQAAPAAQTPAGMKPAAADRPAVKTEASARKAQGTIALTQARTMGAPRVAPVVKTPNANRPAAAGTPVSATPARPAAPSGRQVAGSFGRARRTEPAAARTPAASRSSASRN